jgi:phosphoribosylformylglycinamidine cyclo-ligase
MYEGEDYDLAGFSVGVVEASKIIDGSKVKAGDVLIGLASSGAHSNGYSLLRKILDVKNVDLTQIIDGRPLADVAMEPTRIYVKPVLELCKQVDVHAMAHITGGGLPGNLPRVLPNGAQAVINESSWEWPELFKLLQREGGVEQFEMYRTFNCGVGMVIAVDANDADKTIEVLTAQGEKAWKIGHIQENPASVEGADEKIRVIFA